MINLRCFVPVLALAAMALPAGATIADYCSGTATTCGTNSETAFNTAVTTNGYTYEGQETFLSSDLSGVTYTDLTSGVVFTEAYNNTLSVSGTALKDQQSANTQAIAITLPVTVFAIYLNVAITNGVCIDSVCPTGETSGFVGMINNNPTGSWTVYVYSQTGDQPFAINNFDVATAGSLPPSNTPEVGTLLLIGAGLIAMRFLRRAHQKLSRVPQPA